MFQQMRVGTRLILGFLAVVMLGAIVAGIGIYNMAQMNERAKRMYQNELLGISYVKEASLDQVYVGRALRGALLASNDEQRTQNLAAVDKYKQLLRDNLDKARRCSTRKRASATSPTPMRSCASTTVSSRN
jgi:hypothetical protein